MKGFRQPAQLNRKEKLSAIAKELENLSMAGRINQMMTQQLMQNMKTMGEDLSRSMNLISELQYKILAIQKVANLDVEEMNIVANKQRLLDFNEASDREDKERGFTVGDKVNEQSVIILTSTTEEKDRGIFRSRLKLAECGVPDLITAFMGREVGAKAIVTLNGLEHEVELLAVRQPPAAALSASTTTPGGATVQTPSAPAEAVASNA
jgi:hypothetical protein